MSKKLKFFAMMLTCILLNVNYVWAADDTWSHTFTSTGTVTITDGATTLNGKSWAIATTTGAGSPTCINIVNGYSKVGWQFGSNKSNYYSKVTLSTSAFSSYSVKSVSVVIRLNGNVSTTVAVSQGETNIGLNTVNTANEWHTLTAKTTAGTSGNVSISISTSQAFFINSISVTYAAGGSSYTVLYIKHYSKSDQRERFERVSNRDCVESKSEAHQNKLDTSSHPSLPYIYCVYIP